MSTLAYMNLRFRIGELRSEEEIAQVSFIVFYEMLVLFWEEFHISKFITKSV